MTFLFCVPNRFIWLNDRTYASALKCTEACAPIHHKTQQSLVRGRDSVHRINLIYRKNTQLDLKWCVGLKNKPVMVQYVVRPWLWLQCFTSYDAMTRTRYLWNPTIALVRYKPLMHCWKRVLMTARYAHCACHKIVWRNCCKIIVFQPSQIHLLCS